MLSPRLRIRNASFGAAARLAFPLLMLLFVGAAARAENLPPPTGGSTTVPTIPPGPQGSPIQQGGIITRFISVTGYGVIISRPGEAQIVFLASSIAPSALVALKNNGDLVNKIVAEMLKDGVPKGNITISESSLAPPSKTNGTPESLSSGDSGDTPLDTGAPAGGDQKYTANARIQVITYVVSDATKIVQIGMYGGATGVLGMTFQPRDIELLKQQALISALKDAWGKAEILAAGIATKIIYAISVSELPAAVPDIPGKAIAPPAEIPVPVNIQVVYAIG